MICQLLEFVAISEEILLSGKLRRRPAHSARARMAETLQRL